MIIETLNYERGDEDILRQVLAAFGQQTMSIRKSKLLSSLIPTGMWK